VKYFLQCLPIIVVGATISVVSHFIVIAYVTGWSPIYSLFFGDSLKL